MIHPDHSTQHAVISEEGNEQPAARIPHEIWVLVGAAFIIAVGYGLISPIIPQFLLTFGISMGMAGLVISVFAGARLVFAPGAGWAIDKLGSRRVYLTGLFLVATTTALIALAQEYWHIVVLRTLAGIGSTMFTVSAMTLIVQLSPRKIRGRCSSAYASGFLFGSILGPVLGGLLAPLGMRVPFAIYGVVVFVAALSVWWRMPRSVGMRNVQQVQIASFTFGEAIRDRAYRLSLFSAFANGWTNFGARVAILPLFAAAIFDNGATIAGVALSIFAAGNAVALQFAGKLADTIGRKPLIVSGLLLNGLATGVFGFSSQLWLFLVASVVAGFGAGLFNPAQQAVLGDVVGTQRSGGKVLANFQMAQDFGAILSPILLGFVAEAWGFAQAYLMCGVLTVVAGLFWLAGRETLQPGE
ncbi:MAG: MFS transporter [Corynebacterium sp.]|nr:MFS transporter [Corynebacterium sp.]